MNRRVVITGLGILSPNGIGKDEFFQAILDGASGIKPISLFDTSAYKVKTAGEIANFQPEKFLGQKGLRILDRSTKLINCAAALALSDAQLQISEENSRRTGVAVGSTLGSIKSIMDFDSSAIKDGIKYVNPALFPNTVINSPASQVSIRFNIKSFNVTFSSGLCSSLDAIKYAVNFIKMNRADVVLAGGVEELCEQTFVGFYRSNCLAGQKDGSLELSCPFDKRRNGVVLGEGACLFVLEDLESALKRKAKIYAEIISIAVNFDAGPNGLMQSMATVLDKAGINPEEIDFISSGANSSVKDDVREARALSKVFSNNQKGTKVSAVKSMLGESFSASAAMQVASGLCAIEKQLIPPTINYAEPDPECDLTLVTKNAKEAKLSNILVYASDKNGTNVSLVLRKYS